MPSDTRCEPCCARSGTKLRVMFEPLATVAKANMSDGFPPLFVIPLTLRKAWMRLSAGICGIRRRLYGKIGCPRPAARRHERVQVSARMWIRP